MPFELGAVACSVTEVTGKTVTNPYPQGSFAYKDWEEGYEHEVQRIRREEEQDSK